MAQIVITERDHTFDDNNHIVFHWDVTLLNTGKLVARMKEWHGGTCELVTFGNHPGGNRYRRYRSNEEMNKVLVKWARRRYGAI